MAVDPSSGTGNAAPASGIANFGSFGWFTWASQAKVQAAVSGADFAVTPADISVVGMMDDSPWRTGHEVPSWLYYWDDADTADTIGTLIVRPARENETGFVSFLSADDDSSIDACLETESPVESLFATLFWAE